MVKRIFGFIILFLILLVSLSFVSATHIVTNSSLGTSFMANEDFGYVYNITINNTDPGQAANITRVNISFPATGNFIFNGFNGTNAPAIFSNTSSVLSWTNITAYVINGSELKYFWFNLTIVNPGTFNITVTTLNSTGEYSTNLTLIINDITPPERISITYPSNTTYNTSISSINYTAIDNGVLSRCWYSNSSGVWNSTSNAFGTNFTNVITTEGSNSFTVYCNDSAGNTNVSSAVVFTKDTVNPSLVINSPVAFQNLSSRTLTINITATDGTTLINYTNVTIYNSTMSPINSTKNTTNGNFIATLSVPYDGIFLINATSYDNATNRNSTTLNVTVDTVKPTISLVYPDNSTPWTSSPTVTFTYNVSDAGITSGIANCSLIINNAINDTNTSVTTGNQTFTEPLSNANYNWSVNCTDYAGNTNLSETRLLTVSYTAPSTGGSSSGGGGGTYTVTTYNTTDSQLASGFTKELPTTARIKFTFNGASHFVTMNSASASQITVTVSSTPQKKTIALGTSALFDINGDNVNDISVKYLSFANNKPTIVVTKVMPAAVATPPIPAAPSEPTPQTNTPTTAQKANVLSNSLLLWPLLIIIVVVLVGLIIYFLVRTSSKKKHLHHVHYHHKNPYHEQVY